MKNINLLTGRLHPQLAKDVAKHLNLPLGDIKIWDFGNMETFIKLEESMCDKDVFIIQPTTYAKRPAEDKNGFFTSNDAMMELLMVIRTLKENSAYRVTAIIPYFGQQQSDKKDQSGVGVMSKLWADLLATSGVDRVVCLDLHAEQILGFFDTTKVTVDHLYANWSVLPFLETFIQKEKLENIAIASPDAGGTKRAQFIANYFKTDMVFGHKARSNNKDVRVMGMVGEVKNKHVIIWDDLIDSGRTTVQFAQKLKENGAQRIFAVVTHGVLSGNAAGNIHLSDIEKLFITDSTPLGNKTKFIQDEKEIETNKIEVISIAALLAETIKRIHEGVSLSDLFVKIR